MTHLLNRLKKRMLGASEVSQEEVVETQTKRMANLVGDCDVCGNMGVGHEYTEVGSVISPGSSCEKFEEWVVSEDWPKIVNSQEFEGIADTLYLSAIRSHTHQEIVVVLWVSPAALYGHDLFISRKLVHGKSARLLADSLSSNTWISLSRGSK